MRYCWALDIQDTNYATNHVVLMRLGDFRSDYVAGTRVDRTPRNFDVTQVQLAVDFGCHAFKARFPHKWRVLGRAFH
jgi:hypothetical protein